MRPRCRFQLVRRPGAANAFTTITRTVAGCAAGRRIAARSRTPGPGQKGARAFERADAGQAIGLIDKAKRECRDPASTGALRLRDLLIASTLVPPDAPH